MSARPETGIHMSRQYVRLLSVFGAVLLSATAAAQNYPAKTVRLLAPFSAGSGSDTISRIYAGGLAEVFGQQVIVENRAGAAGNIGAEVGARAPADGYTLLLVNIAHAVNVSLYRKLAYDPMRDFTPVVPVGISPSVLVVSPARSIRTVSAPPCRAYGTPRIRRNTLRGSTSGTASPAPAPESG